MSWTMVQLIQEQDVKSLFVTKSVKKRLCIDRSKIGNMTFNVALNFLLNKCHFKIFLKASLDLFSTYPGSEKTMTLICGSP